MIFSENWLREWIDLKLDIDGLVDCLTMSGLEVDSVQPAGPTLDQVVVGRIVEVQKHPQASRLKVCQVDVGKKRTLEVVCGAPNARIDLHAPLAVVGATLRSGTTIEQSVIRGVASNGMLCSARELDLGDDAGGLLELGTDAKPGQSVHDYLDLGDNVIAIDLTPNRGDCLSILGVARELSVLTGAKLKLKDGVERSAESDTVIPISIESPERCPRYVGRVITGIDPSLPTPCWMRERLRRCDVRPINPVVDVTNYVMLELGQPMHAFDKNRLHEGIVVRVAQTKETITLLDESSHSLDAETLVIADDSGAIALAGIMGGSGSAISEHTDSIFLESAFFSPATQAGRARHYGLHTDSSYRFERGVDPELPVIASHYATALLKDIVGGTPGPVIEVVHEECLPKRQPVVVRYDRINKLLGVRIPKSKVNKILSRVGSKVDKSDASWKLTPPSFRFDIDRECDLIEEIARVNGYDELPSHNLQMDVTHLHMPEEKLELTRLKQALVDRDYSEVVTYSFVDPEIQQRLEPNNLGIPLANPLASNLSVMRVSLWPGLLHVLRANLNRQHRRIRLFEVGKTFHQTGKHINEVERLGGVVMGSAWPEQWGQADREVDFFDVKSDLEVLFALTGAKGDFSFHELGQPSLHPGQSAEIRHKSADCAIGRLGRLHPEHQEALEFTRPVYLFELDLSVLRDRKMPVYRGISRFPAIRRDLAVLVDEDVSADELLKSIEITVGADLTNLELFDVYRREGVDSKRKSLAFSLTLKATSRTLIDSEVDSIIDRTLDELRRRFGAELRT